MYPQLENGMHFRLDKINKTKDYFITDICQKGIMSKTLSKCIAAFDSVDKTLLILPSTKWQCFYCFTCYCYWCVCCKFWFIVSFAMMSS